MGRIATIARRTLLIGSVAIAGGVAFGYWKYRQPHDNPLDEAGGSALTEYIRIDASGITIVAPRAEMGQGVMTTLAALVAEELDVGFNEIAVEHGPASAAYYTAAMFEEGVPFVATDTGWMARNARHAMAVPAKFMGMQVTGGSSSIPDAYEKMRVAGAAAREVLIEAASARLGVAHEQLKTESGEVIAPDGQRLAYASLAEDAASLDPPADPPLKPRSDWTLLGTSLPRVDMIGKCTGLAEFAIDVSLPEMVYATVKMNPHLGAGMTGFAAAAAHDMRGVIDVIALSSGGAAVIADNTWRAFRAADAVTCTWEKADYPPGSDGMAGALAASFTEDHQDSRFRDEGDIEAALAGETVEVEYRVPYLAHATMEPMTAAAWLRDGRLDVWAGTQFPTQVRAEGEALTGLDGENIAVHTTLLGGGFGRRAEMDFIHQVIEIAKATEGRPVKLTWTREEDTTHDAYRPPAIARFRGAVKDGKPAAFDLSIAAPSVMESQMGRIGVSMPGPDVTLVQGAWDQPFDIPNHRVTGYRTPALAPLGSWRSVGNSYTGFFHESAMDEMAHAAGIDPMAMRLDLVNHAPSRKVLERVAEMSGWGEALPAGHGRGVGFTLSFGVPTAQVIEVSVSEEGVRMEKAFAAVDVGVALDPRNIEAQVQGGMVYGLTAAIMGEVTFEDDRVQQTNFHDYPALRMQQTPSIEVAILENGEKIRGIGEPGTPPAAPALANAIFAATGERLRSLPLNKHVAFV